MKFPRQELRFGGYLIGLSWVIAIFYNIPRFFEFQASSTILVETVRNGTILPIDYFANASEILKNENNAALLHQAYDQDLRKNPIYVHAYLFWSKLVLIELIPYFVMITVNICVRKKLRKLSRISNGTLDNGK